jgi:hypothetical protein
MRNLIANRDERVFFKDRESRFLLVNAGWLATVGSGRSLDEVVGIVPRKRELAKEQSLTDLEQALEQPQSADASTIRREAIERPRAARDRAEAAHIRAQAAMIRAQASEARVPDDRGPERLNVRPPSSSTRWLRKR